MTLNEFLEASGASPEWYELFRFEFASSSLSTRLRQAHYLGQLGHESASFKRLVENLNYSAEALRSTWPGRFNAQNSAQYARNPEKIANYVYGGRMGNTKLGDGWKFRGRGLIHVTGRENYRNAGIELGLPLESDPDLAMRRDVAIKIATWYWDSKSINRLADKDDLIGVTRAINGGTHGLDDRRFRTAKAKKALGL